MGKFFFFKIRPFVWTDRVDSILVTRSWTEEKDQGNKKLKVWIQEVSKSILPKFQEMLTDNLLTMRVRRDVRKCRAHELISDSTRHSAGMSS